MAASRRSRKPNRSRGRGRQASTGGGDRGRPPSTAELARTVVQGGRELLKLDDPLEAEAWASQVLGSFYKLPVPYEARLELDRALWPAVLAEAEARADRVGLAVLVAMGALADDAGVAADAQAAADRLRSRGIVPPLWAAEVGSAAFEGAWMLVDVFGDHEAYFATYRYPGRKPHLVNALYDKAMGEIIKDGFVGYGPEDLRQTSMVEDGVSIVDADPAAMARRITDAIANGDMYLDNDWTPEFKRFRALIVARMRQLPIGPEPEPPEAPDDETRQAWIDEFLVGWPGQDAEEAAVIAAHCLDYSCDYLGDDGFRWSPIVVEQFPAGLPAAEGVAEPGPDRSAARRAPRLGALRALEARPG